MVYEARIVSGRDEHGTTYETEGTVERQTLTEAINAVACNTQGQTWDVFSRMTGDRMARVHVDGGVDWA